MLVNNLDTLSEEETVSEEKSSSVNDKIIAVPI